MNTNFSGQFPLVKYSHHDNFYFPTENYRSGYLIQFSADGNMALVVDEKTNKVVRVWLEDSTIVLPMEVPYKEDRLQ